MIHYENQEQLDADLAKWQRILRLEDWHVWARLVYASEQTVEGSKGEVHIWEQKQEAAILILEKGALISQANPLLRNEPRISDQEKTLVHELIHIRFWPFEPKDPDSLEYALWEQAVETLAWSLVSLERSGNQA